MMAKFLNTSLMSEWIERLIEETEKELIILVPYINISDKIFRKLEDANTRGVETVIIYRENKLHDRVKTKLLGLDNLNLLHHPNLHAKCYYNEKYLIIGSMNLYEYSEKNNREMGVLLHKETIDGVWGNTDDDVIFKDAINEIRDIIKGSELERESRDTIENGFELDIIKTDREKALESCKRYNKYFVNKFFEPVDHNGEFYAHCKNFYDRVDVTIDHRITISFNLPPHHLKNIYEAFQPKIGEYMYEGFKFYWNHHTASAYIYKDTKHRMWNGQPHEEILFKQSKQVLSNFINELRPMMIIK